MPSASEPSTSVLKRSAPLLGNSTGVGARLSRYSQITLLSKMAVPPSMTRQGILPSGLAVLRATLSPGLVSVATISIRSVSPFMAMVSFTLRP